MNTKFKYALLLTVISAVFQLVMYVAGFQTDKLETGQHLNWISLVFHVGVLWMGLKAVRESNADKSLGYGQGVGAGVLISLYSGLMSGVYAFVHYKFINPDYFDHQMVLMRSKWAEAGLSDDKIEQAETVARKFLGPVTTALMTPVGAVIGGTLIALVLAAILKRPAPAEVPPVLPPSA